MSLLYIIKELKLTIHQGPSLHLIGVKLKPWKMQPLVQRNARAKVFAGNGNIALYRIHVGGQQEVLAGCHPRLL